MIHVIGLGGIGFWLTVGLVRSVPSDQITVWDDDTLVGGRGHMRLPYALPETSKVDLLRGFLLVSMGEMSIPHFTKERFTGRGALNPGDLILDCTDMPRRNRSLMWTYSKKSGAKCLRASYDGKLSTIVLSSGLPLIAPEEGGYSEIPTLSLSMAAGGMAAEVVRQYIQRPIEHLDMTISLGEMFVPIQERILMLE